MCPKSVNDEMEDLYRLVTTKLDPEAPPSVDSYIEEIETSPPKKQSPPRTPTKKATKQTPLKPALPPPAKPPNFFQRTFSFSDTTKRGYYFWNTLVLAILSVVVIALVDERELDEGWGILLLALAAWSFVANTIKRWRDTGYNMWWLITLFIPYVSFVTTLFVFFAPSKDDP